MRKLGLRGRRQVLRFEQREYQKIKLEKVGLQRDLQSKYNLKKMLSWDKKKQDVDVGQLGGGGGVLVTKQASGGAEYCPGLDFYHTG